MWMKAWIVPDKTLPDLKIDVICPATDVHIQKVRFDLLLPSQMLKAMVVCPSGLYHGSRDSRYIREDCKTLRQIL
jgi:hypothetical protein